MKAYLVTILFIGFTFVCHSSSKVVELHEKSADKFIVREYMLYYEDPTNTLNLKYVQQNPSLFKISTLQDLTNKNKNATYWLKFRITNLTHSTLHYNLELFDYNIENITFYYKNKQNKYRKQSAGFAQNFSKRNIKHKNFIFPIIIQPKDTNWFYLKVKSSNLNLLEPCIRSHKTSFEYTSKEYYILGIFYGLLILIICYNLIYFLVLKKKYYLWYLNYVCSFIFYSLSNDGLGFQFLWPNHPVINLYSKELSVFLCSISMLIFVYSYIDNWSKSYRSIIFLLLLIRMTLFGMQMSHLPFHSTLVMDLIIVQIILYIGFKNYKKGYHYLKWFVIAYSIFDLFFIISILEDYVIIPSFFISVYAFNLGVIFQFVFLSIGLAEKINQTYIDRNNIKRQLIKEFEKNKQLSEKVNKELEIKIQERTIALSELNQKLTESSEENLRMNIMLDKANSELKRHLSDFALSSVSKPNLSFDEFKKAYPDDLSCMRFLEELKEKNGFICIKCKNQKTIKGKSKFDRRCSSCNYNESVTANTLFHHCKFPLQKAFYICYVVSYSNVEYSATELAQTLELQPVTCQSFKLKVTEKIERKVKSKKWDNFNWEKIILD